MALQEIVANKILDGVDVNIQDQTTRVFDTFFSKVIGSPILLTASAVLDSWTVSLTTGHGVLVGEQVVIYDYTDDRLYVGSALASATNIVTLDTPINYDYHSSHSIAIRSTKEMNVNGSSTRQVFSIAPPIQSSVDITRVMFQMTTTAFPEMDMFGDIAGGLARGIVMRSVNGINVNYFNIKTNGEMVNLMYDVNFYEAAKHGTNGLGGRMTYGGKSKHGSVIRLGTGDSLELIIQDNLTSILSFRMIATGHVVED